jgi:protein-tyrosine-phosphatase
MRILFVCRWNRFRSKVAEAYFNKINADNEIVAESAGINGSSYKSLDPFESRMAQEMGITLTGVPRPVDVTLLASADLIIVVANDVLASDFNPIYRAKMEFWNIGDLHSWDRVKCKAIIKQIMLKVDDLADRMQKGGIR